MPDQPLVVVTGSAGAIGSAVVAELQTRGCRVLGADMAGPGNADEHLSLDLGSPTCGEAIAAAVDGRPVAGLVNNAAVAVYTTIEDTPTEVWDRVIDVNLRAAFLIGRAVLPDLRRARGAVVNVSSVHAEATSVGIAAYAASKGGLLALTRAMALEWAPDRIRVNCVLPGAVDTPMLAEGLSRSASTVESLGLQHPLGRVADAAEVARAIAFLLSEEASYLTGSSLRVDGGALARLSTE